MLRRIAFIIALSSIVGCGGQDGQGSDGSGALQEAARNPCALQERRLTPGPQTYVPPWVQGDRDFDGNGPFVRASVRLSARGNELWARIHMRANETVADFTQAAGVTNRRLQALPAHLEIYRILGGQDETVFYLDEGYDVDTFDGALDSPVAQWSFVGDTPGDDAGGETRVTVAFRPIMVLVIDRNLCPEGSD